ncbi:prolipoprotein diacylglyceryl transferase [Blattabacterium cuenoti]|uniref:prolipoprotein diacylglyceryl transferase n=1 Tax=Blattabacterium cuenoti TaxID=1653831 RepID=UPI00163BCB83|nr:prolipoprotein diacylglyceryl transferase [Blattabacterium cuenoti]
MEIIEYINWNPINKFNVWRGISIHIYSLMFIISFILGWYIMYHIYENDNINCKYLDPLLRYTFFGTLIGARLGQVVFYDLSYFSNHWIEAVLPIKENYHQTLFGIIKGYEFVGYRGLSSHGAALGILFTNFLYKKQFLKDKSFIWLCDRICIAISISSMFIRIGNFFNSEIIGKPCRFPWAVKFLQMDKEYGKIIPRHPTQLYESIVYLITFITLLIIYKKVKKLNNGLNSGIFFIFVWFSRFLIEFLKEPQGNEFIKFFNLNTGQCLSIPLFCFGIFLLIFSVL